MFERNNELQIPGGSSGAMSFLSFVHRTHFLSYFFEHALRFASDDYLPNQEDILRAKVRTTGISETVFKVSNTTFQMVDVGGQRSERRKWLHCFDSVRSHFFFALISHR